MKHFQHASLACALLACSTASWAGRPLATDDAATADAGTCQLESWYAHDDDNSAVVVAPACGVVPGLELDADYTHSRHRDLSPHEAGLAVKWAPASWAITTPAGELAFGLKLGTGFAHPADEGWRSSGTTLLGLATWVPRDGWAVHFNLGLARDRDSATTATLANLAVAWEPIEQALLFVEAESNNRREIFGGTTTSAGGRWWLIKDKLGLDLTTHHTGGAGGNAWTLGIGWYGLSF